MAARGPVEAVVVAAGSSSRMGGVDKLDADLGGKSVLRRSIEALAGAGVSRIVVVTAPDRIAWLAAASWLPDQVVAIVAGGPRRQESVAAGVVALAEPGIGLVAPLRASGAMAPAEAARPASVGARLRDSGMPEDVGAAPAQPAARAAAPLPDPVLLIHDAARPLASPGLIAAIAEATAIHGAAIPTVPVAETLKRVAGSVVEATVDRTGLVAAQTPQGVRRSLLERAYSAFPPDGSETWTDEASLLEACRIAVHAIDGEGTNLKLTVPADLELARSMLDRGAVPGQGSAADPGLGLVRPPAAPPGVSRVGLGLDSHPFGPGGTLALGGVRIEGVPRLVGHSDGDVALHAVADALLGAASLGDLGRLFPADARTPAGIDSRILLGSVAERVRAAGWDLVNVDLTIVGARPRLAGLLPSMAESIAGSLGLALSAVNVKASSGNLSGPEGAGRSISASAIVTLGPLDTRAGKWAS